MGRRLFPLLMAAALAAALTACGRTATPPGTAPTDAVGVTVIAPDERQPAPPIAGELLSGGRLDLAEEPARWTVVNAWASWCEPCQTETPELVAFAAANPRIRVVGLDVQDRTGAAQEFVRAKKVDYPNVLDPDGTVLATIPGVPPKALPSTVVIDPQGRIAARAVGAVTRATLDQMLVDAGATVTTP